MSPLAWQLVSLTGAALDLGAYVAAVRGKVPVTDGRYLAANFVGTALLFAAALHMGDLGFIALNGAWLWFTAAAIKKSRGNA